jgi:quinoprotein glucose dehydrogenase
MSMSIASVECRPGASKRLCPEWARSLLGIAGAFFAMMGVAMAVKAAFAGSGGSTYYWLAGIGLIISGLLLANRHIGGLWALLGVFAATLIGSLRDAGLGGSSFGYRMVGPLIILSMAYALMPFLRRSSSGRIVRLCTALMVVTVAIGIVAGAAEPQRPTTPSQPALTGVRQ